LDASRIRMVADVIEQAPDEAFDMYRFLRNANTECGTAACIAGHTYLVALRQGYIQSVRPYEPGSTLPNSPGSILIAPYNDTQTYTIPQFARQWLGLSDDETVLLFLPRHTTRKTAVKVLRTFAETGLIDWNV